MLKQNMKKVWEPRSHVFPPHYTPEYKLSFFLAYCTDCVISQMNTVQQYLHSTVKHSTEKHSTLYNYS